MAEPPVAVLRAFGVPDAAPRPLAGGTSGATWKVRGGDRSYVLRRHHDPRPRPAHVRSELLWLDALGQDGAVPTPHGARQANGALAPTVEAGPDGRARALWTMLGWVDGETLGRLPDEHEAALTGAMLATLHRSAAAWSPPPGFVRPAYDAEHFAGAARALLARFGAHVGPGPRRGLDAALRLATDALERLERDADQVGLIHADLHDGNIVYGGDPRRAGAIDFARCGFGCWALDLAMALHYLTDDLGDPMIGAYRADLGLTPDAERALPHLRFLAAIDNLATLSALPDEADDIVSELPDLTTQAERLLG